MEIQGFRDRAPEFARAGVALVGASFDTPQDNGAFAAMYGFDGTLLSDVDRAVGTAYETKRADEESSPEYAKRRTFVIDPDGVIRRVYRVRDIPAHPAEVLADLRELGAIGGDG
jgi:thioredoxin-dependent peroxiredoxin